jgi:hypothetical protein
VNDGSFIMENGRLALKQKEKASLFGDFWHMKMILHI